jgi:hypothetical protein
MNPMDKHIIFASFPTAAASAMFAAQILGLFHGMPPAME